MTSRAVQITYTLMGEKAMLITLQMTQKFAFKLQRTWIRIRIRNPDLRLDPDPKSGSRKKRIFDKLTMNCSFIQIVLYFFVLYIS